VTATEGCPQLQQEKKWLTKNGLDLNRSRERRGKTQN
jgi:hypothetical protein